MLSSSAPVLSIAFTDEKWVLPARAEAANRSIATGNTYCSMDDCPEIHHAMSHVHLPPSMCSDVTLILHVRPIVP